MTATDDSEDPGVRPLRPGRVVVLPTGLWVIDEVQPVAVVLDPSPGPAAGRVRQVVSWAQVPRPPRLAGVDVRCAPVACADAQALWVQQHPDGPLLRVGSGGVEVTAWTRGLRLTAAAGTAAWCAPAPPRQELVRGTGALPAAGDRPPGGGELLRVSADGRVRRVPTDAPVRALRVAGDTVWVQLDVAPYALRPLGAGTHEVTWAARWVPLPADGPLPEEVRADAGQETAPDAPVRPLDGDGRWEDWYEPDGREVAAAGHRWRFGWRPPERGGRGGSTIVTALDPGRADGPPVGTVELPTRGVQVAVAAGHHLVVLAHCQTAPPGAPGQRPGRYLLALEPPAGPGPGAVRVQVWLAPGEVDVGDSCWPLGPEPLDAGSYTRQVLDEWSGLDAFWHGEDGPRPLARGLSRPRVRLVGSWPHTHLEVTFDFAPRPGVRLRRRVALFDELGAIAHPEFADVGLMEDLETGRVPPADRARDGVLDV